MTPAALLPHFLDAIEGLPVEQALCMESLVYGALQAGAEHRRWLADRAPPSPSVSGTVEVNRTGDALNININRPQARNAINTAIRDGLNAAFDVALHDPDLKTIKLTSAGKAFCIGGDLAEFGTTTDPITAHIIRMKTLPARIIAGCADRLEIHVQGACIGAGLEIAAFAKRITASPRAWFQLPEVAMGLIPGAGGCISIPRRIGKAHTLEMLLSGKRISAQTASAWGLIDAIVDD